MNIISSAYLHGQVMMPLRVLCTRLDFRLHHTLLRVVVINPYLHVRVRLEIEAFVTASRLNVSFVHYNSMKLVCYSENQRREAFK